uniref:Toxin 3FTx-Tri3 n=1 Tax=Trimorphodon biscutatus TaxID=338818 RepID=3NB3_TRIBI|nr:RecName: Full=Toxin 3FTx-Tri3; Flags: Precursor [Trimorphodon biscutatus]ABU68478.1 3FTx-Tri3 [Trimorphodon biscutatus]
MKTLLLALVVVAFMCLGSADEVGLGNEQIDRGRRQAIGPPFTRCSKCNRNWSPPFPLGLYTVSHVKSCGGHLSSIGQCGEDWVVKGCAKTCPTAGPGERVKCCYSPRCNKN